MERESTAAPAPRVSVHAAARPRLFAQLNDAVRFPLAVVRGPAGAGKTVLLADWVCRPPEQGGPGTAYAWLQTDALAALPADGQRRAFWQLAAAALGLGGHDEPFESVLRSSPDPRLLVVDGAHLLADPALEEDLVRLARSELPLHILLATRTVLGLERRLPLLDIDIAVVGPDELRLTAAETHAVLAGGWLAECSAEVHERTAGLPWLVRAAKLRAAAAAAGRPHRNRAGAVYTLLAADAAAALDALAPCPELRRFMVLTSLPEHLTAGVAAELAAGEGFSRNAAALLLEVETRGLGFWSGDDEARFCYVPFLREALAKAFEEHFPGRRRELLSRCARFADRQGRGADALGYAVQAQDYALATQIVRAHVLELLAGTSRRTWGVLETIPLPSLARYPLLAMLLALKYNSRSHLRLKALELFGIAAAGSRLLGKSLAPADRLLLEVVESVALRVCGQLELAQGPARSALGRYRNMAPGERDRIGPGEPYCLIHLGRTFAAAGRSTEAAQALQLAAAAGLERDMAWISGSALTVLAAFEADEGNLAGAAGHLEQARAAGWAPERPGGGISAYSLTPFRMARAWLALEAGDAAGARQELDFIRGEFRTSEFWPELRRLEAMADIQAGQPGLALGRLRSVTSRLRDFPPASRRATERLKRLESWLQLALGNSAEVGRLMAGSNGGGPGGLLRAWAHLMGRNPAGALRAALPQLESEQPRIRHAALLAVVASRLQDGGTSGLADPLAELAGLHETYGLRLAANWLPGPDRDRVAAAAAERGWNLGIDGQARPVFPGDIVVVILSDRERVVLAELARTGSAAEIAARQFVSVNTVKSQLRSLYRKLDAANREDALGAAVRYGLLEPAHPAGAAERNGAGNRG